MYTGIRCSSAGCLIIGNEILNGSVKEANLHPLAKTLFDRGVSLKTVEVVSDDFQTIETAIKRMKQSVDYIFTTGGIGSTHDDVTYEAIARTFNETLELDKTTESLLGEQLKKNNKELNDERRRMCIFPTNSTIYRTKLAQSILDGSTKPDDVPVPISWVPLVVTHNCYIFPGVPHIFRFLLKEFEDVLPSGSVSKMIHRNLFGQVAEGDVAKILRETQEWFDKQEKFIQIGSYPELIGQNEIYQIRISLTSPDEIVINEAEERLLIHHPFRREPFGELYVPKE